MTGREGAGEESAARGAAYTGCRTPTAILADVPTQTTQNRQLIVFANAAACAVQWALDDGIPEQR